MTRGWLCLTVSRVLFFIFTRGVMGFRDPPMPPSSLTRRRQQGPSRVHDKVIEVEREVAPASPASIQLKVFEEDPAQARVLALVGQKLRNSAQRHEPSLALSALVQEEIAFAPGVVLSHPQLERSGRRVELEEEEEEEQGDVRVMSEKHSETGRDTQPAASQPRQQSPVKAVSEKEAKKETVKRQAREQSPVKVVSKKEAKKETVKRQAREQSPVKVVSEKKAKKEKVKRQAREQPLVKAVSEKKAKKESVKRQAQEQSPVKVVSEKEAKKETVKRQPREQSRVKAVSEEETKEETLERVSGEPDRPPTPPPQVPPESEKKPRGRPRVEKPEKEKRPRGRPRIRPKVEPRPRPPPWNLGLRATDERRKNISRKIQEFNDKKNTKEAAELNISVAELVELKRVKRRGLRLEKKALRKKYSGVIPKDVLDEMLPEPHSRKRKISHWTEERRKKMSDLMKKKWREDEEWREKMFAAIASRTGVKVSGELVDEVWTRQRREEARQRMLLRWQNPFEADRIRKRKSFPETEKDLRTRSQIMVDVWKKPGYRAKMAISFAQRKKLNPAHYEKVSATIREQWRDPEFRKRVEAGLEKYRTELRTMKRRTMGKTTKEKLRNAAYKRWKDRKKEIAESEPEWLSLYGGSKKRTDGIRGFGKFAGERKAAASSQGDGDDECDSEKGTSVELEDKGEGEGRGQTEGASRGRGLTKIGKRMAVGPSRSSVVKEKGSSRTTSMMAAALAFAALGGGEGERSSLNSEGEGNGEFEEFEERDEEEDVVHHSEEEEGRWVTGHFSASLPSTGDEERKEAASGKGVGGSGSSGGISARSLPVSLGLLETEREKASIGTSTQSRKARGKRKGVKNRCSILSCQGAPVKKGPLSTGKIEEKGDERYAYEKFGQYCRPLYAKDAVHHL
uniref:HMG box domain-containing protein n=1 Tax=Chromera velia CCMP2878 TaxID=1169474 RepID=A0A0G4FXL7_9ALVE|eukprot:Cvel_19249.t1-p1 / transcript=Cvel_19249.t1 / gene=Cvel_19249 / organism=Chromera_velia_CCMP2878 / gene_product=hypothetical protein / transcript_product=hypothetical protein / location=Cvel_scaffold1647:7989-28061(-) / protein_length=907 / sequence_SO=supercontig / SO=protein_coding / is_pseudo=false